MSKKVEQENDTELWQIGDPVEQSGYSCQYETINICGRQSWWHDVFTVTFTSYQWKMDYKYAYWWALWNICFWSKWMLRKTKIQVEKLSTQLKWSVVPWNLGHVIHNVAIMADIFRKLQLENFHILLFVCFVMFAHQMIATAGSVTKLLSSSCNQYLHMCKRHLSNSNVSLTLTPHDQLLLSSFK